MDTPEVPLSERLLEVADVGRVLNVSLPMAYRLIQQRQIPVIRINTAVRVKPSDLRDYILRSRQESGTS